MSGLSNKDIDALVEAEYQEALANGEPWAEESFKVREAERLARPVGVTRPQSRVLRYLERVKFSTEPNISRALYGSSKQTGAVHRMARTLLSLGLIEEKTDVRYRSVWNPVWQRTSKPWEVK